MGGRGGTIPDWRGPGITPSDERSGSNPEAKAAVLDRLGLTPEADRRWLGVKKLPWGAGLRVVAEPLCCLVGLYPETSSVGRIVDLVVLEQSMPVLPVEPKAG